MDPKTSELFNTSGPNAGLPSLKDIHQGGYGDCYYLSSVGALAQLNPQALKNMIHDNGNGTYTVTFPAHENDKSSKPTKVTIDPKDIPQNSVDGVASNGGQYGHTTDANGKQVIWPQVMEAAYAKLKGGDPDYKKDYQKIDNDDKAHRIGIPTMSALETVTGKPVHYYSSANTSEKNELAQLQADLKAGKPIVLDTKSFAHDTDTKNNPFGLVGDHAYTVTDVYEKNGKQFVKLNNPWGKDRPQDIPLEKLPEISSGISVGSPERALKRSQDHQHADQHAHHDTKPHHDKSAPQHTGESKPAPGLDNPKNPDHAMYQQALEKVQELDARLGRTPDKHSEQLAAALVVSARHEGLTSIDSVALSNDGSRAFALQGNPDSPLRQMAGVQTAQAVNTPIEQSNAAAQGIPHRQAEQTQANAQVQAQTQAQPQAQPQQQAVAAR